MLRKDDPGLGLGLNEASQFHCLDIPATRQRCDVQHQAQSQCFEQCFMILLRFFCDGLVFGKSNIEHFAVFVEDKLESDQGSPQTPLDLFSYLEKSTSTTKHGTTLFPGRDITRLVAVSYLFYYTFGSS